MGGFSFSGIGGDKTQDCWGQSDVWMVKIDSTGVKQWDVRFGASKMDRSRSVIQTLDGGYFIGAYTNSLQEGDITDPSRGDYDGWGIKIDSNGNKQWDKRYGGSADDHWHLAMQLSDGDYILLGHSQSDISGDKSQSCFGSDDIWMLKLELITVLPIELAQFDVQPKNSGALLEWTTLSENDNNYFAIQRSLDAENFDSIGMVRGQGTSSVIHDYSYFDEDPPFQTVYYRLKQVDYNGNCKFSVVKAVNLPSENSSHTLTYSVYPNPATNYLVLEDRETANTDVVLEIRNTVGLLVFSTTIRGASNSQQIQLPELAAGIYTLNIKKTDGSSFFTKIFISK